MLTIINDKIFPSEYKSYKIKIEIENLKEKHNSWSSLLQFQN